MNDIEGTFQPKKTDDLKPEAVPYIGRRLRWRYLWVHDEGPYTGQRLYDAIGEPYFGWVPEEDLADVVEVA